MEIRLKRSEFLTELAPMQGIVERRTTIPVLSHILLQAEGDSVKLAATDLDVSLTSSCAAEVTTPGGVAVQAKKFTEIMRALVDEQVELSLSDEMKLNIKSGRSRFKINGLSPEDFPTLPEVPADKQIEIPFAQFKRMVSKVIFAVSAEESRFQLNGALLKFKEEGGIELVATDGHRLALVENSVDIKGSGQGVLVPRKALQELQRFDGEDTLIFRQGEHHLSFQVGRRELTSRILEGTFPDYERVIARDNDKEAVFDRKELFAAIQRVALLTGDRARAVRFAFSPEKLVISAVNPDLGEAVEELTSDYKGSEFKLGVNPDYMNQFLGAVETEQVRFELKDENTQCVGFPVDGADQRYLCVVMPMRV